MRQVSIPTGNWSVGLRGLSNMSKSKMFLPGCCLAVSLLFFTASARSQTYTFTGIDVPNAQETVCMDINDGGNAVGYYVEDGVYHGFFLKNGTFTTLTFPDAGSTLAYGINDFDQIVGSYGEGGLFGFEISGGRFVGTINDPNGETYLWGIANTGEIVGSYTDTSGCPSRLHRHRRHIHHDKCSKRRDN